MTRRRPPPPTGLLAALPGAPSFASGSLHGAEEGDLAMLLGLAVIGVAAFVLTIAVLGARRLASRDGQEPEPTDRQRQRQRQRSADDMDPIVAALGVDDGETSRHRRRPRPLDEDRPPSWPAT